MDRDIKRRPAQRQMSQTAGAGASAVIGRAGEEGEAAG